MPFDYGIVDLPNVEKSIVFNALSDAVVQMASSPFSTTEPNRQVMPVPNVRLATLSSLLKKEKLIGLISKDGR